MIQPIGFFDSGVGGLSVLKKAFEKIDAPMVYIGDTARMPYGVRPPEQVERYTIQCLGEIAKYHPQAAVIACNTATAFALKKAREVFDFPIFGVIEPACRQAADATKNKKVALLATQGTVKSGSYETTIRAIDPAIEMVGVGAPELVVAIEHGHLDDETAEEIIRKYLEQFGSFDFDTLILGCTHFPLAFPVFERIYPEGSGVTIVDPAASTIDSIVGTVTSDTSSRGKVEFMATGDIAAFQEVAERFLDLSGNSVSFQNIVLENEEGKR